MNKRRRAVRLSDRALEQAAQYPIGTWVAIRYERVVGSGATRAEAQAQAPGAKHIYQVTCGYNEKLARGEERT